MATVHPTTTAKHSILSDPRSLLFVLLSVVILAYANTLEWVADFWQRPEYSHGYLIPLFACALLWLRRPNQDPISDPETKVGLTLVGIGAGLLLLLSFVSVDSFYPGLLHNVGTAGIFAFLICLAGAIVLVGPHSLEEVTVAERWWGVAIIAGGLALRLVLTWYALITPEMLTLLPVLAGAIVIVGGWRAFAWTWPAIAFLVFMFPLPDVLERELLTPLQRFATIASTFCLQTIGLPAYRDGNAIHLGTMPLHVADECSGLRMLTIFLALCVAVTMVTNRPIWERIVIVLSAIPIAVIVNVARITITAILYQVADAELAHRVFHDLAGWVMTPMALGLLYCELQVLSHLVQDDEDVASDLMESTVGPRVSPG